MAQHLANPYMSFKQILFGAIFVKNQGVIICPAGINKSWSSTALQTRGPEKEVD